MKQKLSTWISVLNELKEIGRPLYGVFVICKNYQLYACCHHEGKKARGCLKDLIEKGNKDKLIFATKDANITQYASTLPGNPVVYLNGNTILLDRPSDATTDQINANAKDKLGLSEKEQAVLDQIREEKRLADAPKPKRKKPQNPNPLRFVRSFCQKLKINILAVKRRKRAMLWRK